MPLRTRSRRTFAPKAWILDCSFLFKGTTYYIAETGQTLNDMVHREKDPLLLEDDREIVKTPSVSRRFRGRNPSFSGAWTALAWRGGVPKSRPGDVDIE